VTILNIFFGRGDSQVRELELKGRTTVILRATMEIAKAFVRAGTLILSLCVIAGAQAEPSSAPSPSPNVAGADSNPATIVAWSLREEYYNLPGGDWSNVFLFRGDRVVLRNRRRPIGRHGVITRLDLPLVVTHRPDGTSAGLGDIYAQAFLIPYLKRKFMLVAGSGVSIPTATDHRLGTGKLNIAPAVVPLWPIPKRGFFFVKVQDFFSVAGVHDRPDLHYMTVTSVLVWRLKNKPYWIQLEEESQTNWNDNAHTGYKAGLLLGRMKKKRGVWIKFEVGIGQYRVGSLAIKTSIFRVR
jgi:hypothetical protein